MDCVTTGLVGNRNDTLNIEISRGTGSADGMSLIGFADMQRGRIIRGKDRDGRNSQLGGSTRDADCDFAAVGNQQLLEQCLTHRAPYSAVLF